jgi:hypothetical protein
MKRTLPSAAAACAVLAMGAGTAGARPSNFSAAAPSAAAHAAGGDAVSKPLRAPKRFNLVGVRWSGGGEPEIWLRARRSDGAWSRWAPAEVHGDHAPDPGRGEHGRRSLSDPVWVGSADWVQYRSSRRLRRVRLEFVSSAGARFRPAVRAAQGEAPPIVPRTAWGAADCPPRNGPSYGQVRAAFVHHTVSTNDYTPEQAPAMVLAICRYHRYSRGWDDVGYNFLVDKYGRIYEGRAGGIDRAVVGAQAQGFNSQTTGISNIGDHSSLPQSEVAVDAMAALIRWKLPLHGQPTTGSVTLTSAGGASNRYPAGSQVALDRVPGHRDGNATACPGDALYAQLPDLRARLGGPPPATTPANPASLNLIRSKSRVRAGRIVRFQGTIEPPKSTTVYLVAERKTAGIWRRAAIVPVSVRDGQLGTYFRPLYRTLYRFRLSFPGDAENAAATSPNVYVRATKPKRKPRRRR